MKKDGYKYLRELLDYLDTQSDEDNDKLFRAAVKYALEGEFPQGLSPEAEHCFYTLMTRHILIIRYARNSTGSTNF